jgi:uncharacterized protein
LVGFRADEGRRPHNPDILVLTPDLTVQFVRSGVSAVFFNVRDLELRAGRFDVDLAPGTVEFLDPKLRQAGPLKAQGKVELVLGEIRAKGHVVVNMEVDCDRCLEPAWCPIDADFELYYRPVEEGFGDEKAIDPGEAEMGFYQGDGIELNDVLREYVLLALPMQRLCKKDCKGICPECGQNRNLKPCACRAELVDDRWAALKRIQ